MDELRLIPVSADDAAVIAEYCAAFPTDRERVTHEKDRIPGLDHLEEYETVADWLRFASEMSGTITWFKTIRCADGKMVGAVVLRHALQYDDDDPEFASHIGYSVRPDERRKGYAAAQLRQALRFAHDTLGLDSVRIVCAAYNTASRSTILRCGGVYVDTLHGEESGIDVMRFDVTTAPERE